MKKFISLLILGLFLFSFPACAAEMQTARSIADIAGAAPATEAVCGLIKVKPLSLTTTDINEYPWPWLSSGDTCSGIAFFETKGEGLVRVKVKIFDMWGYVTDSFNLGDYYFDPSANSGSCTIPST